MRFALRLVVAVLAFGLLAAPASGQITAGDQSKRMDRLFASPNQAINSDFAFWGDHAFSGYYTGDTGTPVGTAPRGGVRIFDISNPAAPRLVKNLQCDGLQADPFVWDRNENGVADLLLVAVDRTMSGPDCGDPRSFKPDGTAFHEDPNGWEGVRVFEMSDDPANPFATITQVDAQYTDCGAHTITGWTGRAHDAVDPHLIVYVSSYPLRPGPTCGQTGSTETPPYANTNNPFDDDPVENDPLHRQIQILKVPLDNPADTEELEPAEISYEHAAMPDPDGVQDWTEKGLTGLEPAAIACHDIVTHMEHNIAGAACAEQGQVWEIDPATGIPDTMNPISIGDDEVSSGGAGQLPGAVDFFHSVMFNNDGTIVNWVDESFGSGCPTMTTYSPRPHNPAGGTHKTGSMFFTDMEGNFLSEFNVGDVRPDTTEGEYCSAHMGMTVAGIKKDLLVNAWYTGGTDVIDFSKPTRLKEIAYYDPDTLTGHWSSYPYTGPLFRKRGGVPVYVSDGVEDPLNAQGMEVYRAKIKTPSRRNLMDHMNPQTMDHGLMMGGGGDDDDDDDDDRGGGRDD